ncbi:D-isomer specific 2-hydroxyacid dehydrogenase family protein [Microlunatus sp. GCM10028923]|uniref:D-isomer specific 2-hydroxyacid dehydrogenase family protein n=1 Tax=Microlunatus sp. GCM10028923 TaxID=3273400 RepID=UPI003614D0A5
MTFSETVRRSPAPVARKVGLTVYGCGPDEADLFRALAPRLGVAVELTDEPVSEDNSALAHGRRCISVGHKTPITPSTLLALRRLGVRYLSTRSIGCNHLDVDYAARIGITVGTVAYSPDSVADYTLMLMLMAVRNAKAMIRRTDLHDYRLHETRGRELRDLTVGVIGTGRIGTAVLQRLRGFGCRTLAYDLRPKITGDAMISGEPMISGEYVPLPDLLRQSDLVTLHTPLTDQTHHLLDQDRIATLKPGAYVINTGRGGLLDTAALLASLESGRLGGAALDVLEGEEGIFYADRSGGPVGSDQLLRLQALPNVIISPHTAYYTDHALRDTVENSMINCLEFESRSQHG